MKCEVCTDAAVVQWGRRVDENTVGAVFSCLAHALTLELAAHVHAADCQAPNGPCNCVREELPAPESLFSDVTTTPAGWTVPVGTKGA